MNSNKPESCEAMYFDLALLGGKIAFIGLILYIAALAAAVFWSIAKGNYSVGTFWVTVLAALPIAALLQSLSFRRETHKRGLVS